MSEISELKAENEKQAKEIRELRIDRSNIVIDKNQVIADLIDENERLREALKGIQNYCDNSDSDHEIFWRIAEQALQSDKTK